MAGREYGDARIAHRGQEKMVATAETGKLSLAAWVRCWARRLAIGFAANYIDGLVKVNVELDHLAAKTGIAIQALSGLQLLVKESEGDWEAITTGLIRMEKNLADGIPPSKQLREALAGIGLTIEELHGLNPEEKLNRISAALAATSNDGNRAAAAIAILAAAARR